MNIGTIATIIVLAFLTFFALIILACIFNNQCIGCNEPATKCKSCKHYGPPLVVSNYEPKEYETEEVYFLAERINALGDDEFKELCKLVKIRGFEDGRD